MKIALLSRATKIVRKADDLRTRGTCCLLAAPEQPVKSRSLHAPMDRRNRSIGLVGMTVCFVAMTVAAGTNPVSIKLAHNSTRELQTALALKQVLGKYDLSKYTFTREVVIEERAMNHAFPVLTLNLRFAASPDELLSSFVHEQLHWYLRDHDAQQKAAIAELRQMYPNAPVGSPEGADSAYSTYGHLVDCYLEIQADRELIGSKRTDEVIKNKPWYTWIYKTILRDEDKIRAVVQEHNLEIR